MNWIFVKVFEWSTDYKCSDCGFVLNIQDDADKRLKDYTICPSCGKHCK